MVAQQLLLLVSAGAHDTDADNVDAAVAELRGAGCDVETARVDDTRGLDAALERRDGRRAVVAGGDGSLHLTVSRLRDRGELADTELGLLPFGTGNDLARGTGVPLDPVAAARALLTATPRRLDLLVGDDDVVLNAVHLGIGVVAARAAGRWKSVLGPLSYAVGALRAGATAPRRQLRVDVDGEVIAGGEKPLLMVAIGNGPHIGGGTPVLPHADPGDGRADVLVCDAATVSQRVGYAAALRSGRHLGSRHVRTRTGTRVTISGEPVAANRDGELSQPRVTWTWQVEPAAWRLLLP